MFRIFTSRREFVVALATLVTVLRFIFFILFVVAAVISLCMYVFGFPHAADAPQVVFMLFSAISGMIFFDALRKRLLKLPCRTRYGIIGSLEPGWSAFVSAQLVSGIFFFAFGVVLSLPGSK